MQRLIKAFFSSVAAFKFGWRFETALRQEMILFLLAIPAGLLVTSNPWKLLALWSSILLVMAIEFLNTGIESLADRVTREHDEFIKIAKDCGSAAVLVAAFIAGSVWILAIFEKAFPV